MAEPAVSSSRSAIATGHITLVVVPRVERQHRLIEELRTSRGCVPGCDLALALGVSVRTIERDVAELQEAGIPITVRRGPGGGYAFDAPSQLPAVVFTPAEAGALVAALVSIGPYASAAAQTSLGKLLSALAVSPPIK